MAKKTKKMQRGRSVETMASGKPIQWQKGRVGQKRKADYMSHVAPGAAKKQLKKQAAAGGPGRRAVSGAGGAKGGGAVKTKKMQAGRMATAGPNVSAPRILPPQRRSRLGQGLGARGAGGLQATRTPEGISQYQPYGRASQQTGPERPNPPGQRASGPELSRGAEARAGAQAGLGGRYAAQHRQMRTPTPPPPPPPKIRPGMKKGGSVPSYNDLIRSKGW